MTTKNYKFIELSHTIDENTLTYEGLPKPIICDFWSREYSKDFYEEGTSFQIGKIEMVANTGTYLDTPFHRYSYGKDLSEITLESLAYLELIVVKVEEDAKAIDEAHFKNLDLENKAVLVRTDWSKHWNTTTYFENHPYLTEDAAKFLKRKKVKLVGIDSYNIDNSHSNRRPVHSILLKNNIPIVEHLTNLEAIPEKKSYFTATPPKIKGLGSFPVRAFALISYTE